VPVGRLNKTASLVVNRQPGPRPGLFSDLGFGKGALRLPAVFPRIVFALALLLDVVNLVVILLTDNPQLRIIVSDAAGPLIDFGACLILFWAARKTAAHYRDLAVAWILFALSMLMSALGGIIWFVLEVILKVDPFPSVTDVFYLAHYPLLLTGLFFLLERRATIGELVTRGLDLLILLGAVVLGFWKFLIEPASVSLSRTVLEQFILLAYPAVTSCWPVPYCCFCIARTRNRK
jgi:hypothetical protein